MWLHGKSRPTKAFTLIELLVVIAIIGVLVGLLLPAIQKIREAADRIKCANNLKQMGLALLQFADDHSGLLPRGGYPQGAYGSTDVGGTWQVHILPYVEQDSVYQVLATQFLELHPKNDCFSFGGRGCNIQNITTSNGYAFGYDTLPAPMVFRCPSDDWDHENFPATNYSGSLGPECIYTPCSYDPYFTYCKDYSQWGYVESNNAGDATDVGPATSKTSLRGCFNRTGTLVRLEDITDGTSNTLLVGEVRPQCSSFLQYYHSWMYYDAGASHAGTAARINYDSCMSNTCEISTSGQVDPTASQELVHHSYDNWNVSWGFKSAHAGGVNFLFADGSVRFIQESIPFEPYNKLGCRNDGMVIPDF